MRKRTLYKIWNRMGDMSLIVLIVFFMLSVGISIFALRANNQTMTKLRQAVYTADEQNSDVEAALTNLRKFVYGHMNTDLRAGSSSSQPPIQLVNQFNRAVEAERARYESLSNSNKVYAEAQAVCEKPSIPLTARAQCIQEYVTTHGQGLPELKLPPKEAYTFDFVGPSWSPDIAGWALVASAITAIFILIRLAVGVVIKHSLRH